MVLKIISAEKVVFEGDASSVTLPGEKGLFTVLPRHASLVSTLVKGKIKYAEAGGVQELEIEGGIADIDHNVVSVCIY
jgi:F-type H+-transporting ATPase subunit epsilon